MKALLRFQWLLMVRLVANPYGAVVGLFAAAGIWKLATPDGPGHAGIEFLGFVIPPLVLVAMGFTLDGLDAVRWKAPMRAGQMFRAHMLFWTATFAVPCAAMGVVLLPASRWPGNVLLFLDLALALVATAAFAPLLHSSYRKSTDGTGSLLRLLGLGVVVVTPIGCGVVAAYSAERVIGAIILLITLAAGVAANAWSCGREERLPVADSGGGDAPKLAVSRAIPRALSSPAVAGGTPADARPAPARTHVAAARKRRTPTDSTTVRNPSVSLLRATWLASPSLTAICLLLYIVIQALPGTSAFTVVTGTVVVTMCLASLALPACSWLLATPIDRGRAARTILLPIVLLSAVAAATRIVVAEVRADRTLMFERFEQPGAHGRHFPALVPEDLVPPQEWGRIAPTLDADFMASKVRRHVASEFALDVPESRIKAAILGTGPPQASIRSSRDQHAAILSAMARVQSDLDWDVAAADRALQLAGGVAPVLLSLLLLRDVVAPARRWYLPIGPLLILLFLILHRNDEAAATANTAVEWTRSEIANASAPLLACGFAVAALLGHLLWRSTVRQFRLLEFTAAPAASPGWGLRRG